MNPYFYTLLGKKKKTQLEDLLTSLSPHHVVRNTSSLLKSELNFFKNTVPEFKSMKCLEINQIAKNDGSANDYNPPVSKTPIQLLDKISL